MARTLTAGMQTAVAATTGTIAHLVEFNTSDGPTYLCTAPVPLSWDGKTWLAVGGAIVFSGVEETTDPAGQGVELTLDGVDQTVIALLLGFQVRGYEVRIWLAHLSDGAFVADPVEIFRGRQLSDYRISETRTGDDTPGTCTVTTRVQSRVSVLKHAVPVNTNTVSHNDMLVRAGLTTGDTFFATANSIAGRAVYWGNRVPVGSGGGGRRQRREDGSYS